MLFSTLKKEVVAIKQVAGQIGIFDTKPINVENECLGEPCSHCDVEWCSISCFLRRGYLWDKLHRFIKGSDGKPLRRNLEERKCKVDY